MNSKIASRKMPVYILVLAAIFVAAVSFYKAEKQSASENSGNESDSETEQAIEKAQEIYAEKKAEGNDFSSGPCIAEDLMPDWVADIAHNPRQAIDNLSENQYQNFREGRVHHFVELDPDGNFIRAK